MLQGDNLIFDGVGQAVVVEVDVAFTVAGLEALAFLDDDAARYADDCRVRRHFFEDDGTAPIFEPSPTVKDPRTLAPQATTT